MIPDPQSLIPNPHAALIAACILCAFWRRPPAPEEAPGAWTGPFSRSDYRRFADLVRAYFRAQGVEVTVEDGYVVVAGKKEADRYGLQNLAQLCHGMDPRGWPTAIAGHFDALREAEKGRQAQGGRRTFAEAAPLLAVRLWPAAVLSQIGSDHAIYREDLPGTLSMLVYDLPKSVENVRPEEAATWGKETAELFELGIENVARMSRPQVRRVELPDGQRATMLSGQSFFVATEALRLSRYPGCVGRHGALVSVPTRHILLCYAIEGAGTLKAVGQLIVASRAMCAEGPGSISDRLYWYHDGHYDVLPYNIEGKRVQLAPGPEFTAMLEQVATEGKEGGR